MDPVVTHIEILQIPQTPKIVRLTLSLGYHIFNWPASNIDDRRSRRQAKQSSSVKVLHNERIEVKQGVGIEG